jgi:DNA polymerase III gamma/tau subunit
MNAVEQSIRKQLESVCGGLEAQYPGLTEAFTSAFFGHPANGVSSAQTKKPRTKKAKKTEEAVVVVSAPSAPEPMPESAPAEAAPAPVEEVKAAEPAPAKESSRKRVVSKKMTESFFAITTAAGKTEEEAKALFETVKKSYKDISDADLQAKGGSFESFAKSVVSGEVPAAPVKEKKTKAKKEKAPTRIAKWTPTLTRTLTKIIEESGSIMTETIKTDFHSWVDALTDEQFAVCAMEGHMRAFLQTKILGGASANLPAAAASAAALPAEDDEELKEFEFEGETLCKGVTSGKIYRPMETGDVWIGNAGVGRFQSV